MTKPVNLQEYSHDEIYTFMTNKENSKDHFTMLLDQYSQDQVNKNRHYDLVIPCGFYEKLKFMSESSGFDEDDIHQFQKNVLDFSLHLTLPKFHIIEFILYNFGSEQYGTCHHDALYTCYAELTFLLVRYFRPKVYLSIGDRSDSFFRSKNQTYEGIPDKLIIRAFKNILLHHPEYRWWHKDICKKCFSDILYIYGKDDAYFPTLIENDDFLDLGFDLIPLAEFAIKEQNEGLVKKIFGYETDYINHNNLNIIRFQFDQQSLLKSIIQSGNERIYEIFLQNQHLESHDLTFDKNNNYIIPSISNIHTRLACIEANIDGFRSQEAINTIKETHRSLLSRDELSVKKYQRLLFLTELSRVRPSENDDQAYLKHFKNFIRVACETTKFRFSNLLNHLKMAKKITKDQITQIAYDDLKRYIHMTFMADESHTLTSVYDFFGPVGMRELIHLCNFTNEAHNNELMKHLYKHNDIKTLSLVMNKLGITRFDLQERGVADYNWRSFGTFGLFHLTDIDEKYDSVEVKPCVIS